MPRLPAPLRHVATYRLAFAVIALTVVFTTVSAATAAGFATATTGAAVRRTLTANRAATILVTAPTTLSRSRADAARVVGALRGAGRGLPFSITASLWSRQLNLPPASNAARGPAGERRQALVVSLPGLQRHARLLRGSWPGGPGDHPAGNHPAGNHPASNRPASGGPVSVSVPVRAARRLHLTVGRQLVLRDSQSRAAVRIRVSGIFRPLSPGDTYWSLDPIGRDGVTSVAGFASYGPLVATAAAIRGGVPVASQAWLAIPDAGRMTARNLTVLGNRIAAADGGLANSATLGAVVSTRLPALLQTLATALLVARSQLLIGLLILLVIAGATLIVAIRLLGSQRAGEGPLLMARGASRRQLARRGAVEAMVLAVPAAIAGPLVAGLVVPLLTRSGPLADTGITLDPGRPAAAWTASSVVAAYSGLIIALPWLRRPPSPLHQATARSRQRVIAATAAAGADLALVGVAVVAGWQLAQAPAAAAAGLTATIGVDPVLAAAPVLALAAGTLVMLRLLPLAARLADRGAARSRGLTFAAAAWQISRRPLRQGGPALLAVLAVATCVLALSSATSWRRSATDQADFAVGASTRITLPPAAPLPIGQVTTVTAARGVRLSTPAVRTDVSLPGGGTGTMLALNGRAAAAIIPAGAGAAADPAAGGRNSVAARAIAHRPAAARSATAMAARAGVTAGGSAAGGLSRAGTTGGGTHATPAGAAGTAALLRQLGRSTQAEGAALPGRPARLVITARLSRLPAASPALAVQLTDGAGVGYLVPAGQLPADGRAHRLPVTIASGTDYPLRLRGFGLQYLMPLTRPARADLTIERVSVAAASGAGPSSTGTSGPLPAIGPAVVTSATAVSSGKRSTDPAVGAVRRDGASLKITFTTGSGTSTDHAGGSAVASWTVSAGPALGALPGIATAAFLNATGNHVGGTVSVPFQGVSLTVRLAGEVSRFPTVTGAGGGLIVDQAALQDALLQAGSQPAAAGEWWLRGPAAARFRGLPAGTSVARAALIADGLRAQPLSAAGLQGLLAVAAAALILAGAGFGVSVAAGRDREHDAALLDALGARRGQVTMLLSLEQALLAVPAAAAGLLLGIVLSHLIIPAVSLTARAARPVPPVLVQIPLLPAVAIAVGVAATPPLAAALAALHRTRATTMLRAEADT